MVLVKAIPACDYESVAVLSVVLVAACYALHFAAAAVVVEVEDCAMTLQFFEYVFLMHRYN